MVTLPVARSGAMQVVLLGRASSPVIWTGGSWTGGSWTGGGGGPFATSSPLLQPATRKAKDTNILVVCLA